MEVQAWCGKAVCKTGNLAIGLRAKTSLPEDTVRLVFINSDLFQNSQAQVRNFNRVTAQTWNIMNKESAYVQ